MKQLFSLSAFVVFTFFSAVAQPGNSGQLNENGFAKIDPTAITIVRDSFGIPHIFAQTDAEVAYGLAWANAEDAFHITQDLICTSKGLMGIKDGIEGVKADFFVHAIGARQLVEERFDKDISPEFLKYLDGFVQGINAYAAAHPEQVKVKKAFPMTVKDMLASYVIIMSALTHAQDEIGDAVGGKFDSADVKFPEHKQPTVGSNAFAFSNAKMADGKTFLCINPHMKMDGQLSFYEAHLQSEEGLNMEGCMFQGSTSLAMGVNENLGWGMTWNHFDRLDVFKLKMNPKHKLQYELDGKWETLEKRPVWLKVNLAKKGKFVLPVKKTTYWSKFGATLKSDKSNNFYAIRFPGNTSIKTGEQLYRMNKAKDYKAYWDALKLHSIALFNIVYADKENNIFYLQGGMLPDRDTTYDWRKLVAGNTSAVLWKSLVPIDKMPSTINPTCGYVYNTNNTPFHSSGDSCTEFICYQTRRIQDERPGDNNRAERFKELIRGKEKFTWQDLKDLKFDVTISKNGTFADSFKKLFELDETKYPDIKEAIQLLKTWNRKAETNEKAVALFGFVLQNVFEKRGCDDDCFISGVQVDEQELVADLRSGCDTLRKYFGTVGVEWGQIMRNIRGRVDLPMRGFPDVLSPVYPEKRIINGRYILAPEYGDTYTMLAEFDKNGNTRLEALQPQGNSQNPASKHYNDQIKEYNQVRLRPLSLKKEEVMKKAESIYHPQ